MNENGQNAPERAACAPTELLYLADTGRTQASATVVALVTDPHRGVGVVLDQTVFYPQGGGQPADHGVMTTAAGEKYAVGDVRLHPDGTVHHYGQGTLAVGDQVTLQIDAARRALHARLHSAGHLVDIAVRRVGLAEVLTPTKGYHFPEGPYVEFAGTLPDASSWAKRIEQALGELVTEGGAIIARELTHEEAAEKGVVAPPGKTVRWVEFMGYEADGCGCGGTHVADISDIGPVVVRQVKSKKGVTKVKYGLG